MLDSSSAVNCNTSRSENHFQLDDSVMDFILKEDDKPQDKRSAARQNEDDVQSGSGEDTTMNDDKHFEFKI